MCYLFPFHYKILHFILDCVDENFFYYTLGLEYGLLKMKSIFRGKSIFTLLSFLTLLIILTGPFIAPIPSARTQEFGCTDLTGINVVIYNGRGTEDLPSSYTALNALFTWMNATTEYVNSSQIRGGILSDFDIVVFPGGSETIYRLALHEDGMENIRQFVASGGSYFGICGGSTFATGSRLGLYDGYPNFDVPGFPDGIYLVNMTVNRASTGPDLSNLPENLLTLYWSSAYYEFENTSEFIPIMMYPGTNMSSMFAFKYGNGTVFLSSPHPEYEEGDSRDGTSQFDYLDDPDSEWQMLLDVSLWLVQASYTESSTSTEITPNTTDTTLTTEPSSTESLTTTTSSIPNEISSTTFIVIEVAGGIVVVLLLIILIVKRR